MARDWGKSIRRSYKAARETLNLYDDSLYDDVCQEMLISLLRKDSNQPFSCRAIDAVRIAVGDVRNKSFDLKRPGQLESEVPSPPDQELMSNLSSIGRQIDEKLWTTFVLREAFGYTWAEIGFITGITHTGVRRRHRRARQALADILRKDTNLFS